MTYTQLLEEAYTTVSESGQAPSIRSINKTVRSLYGKGLRFETIAAFLRSKPNVPPPEDGGVPPWHPAFDFNETARRQQEGNTPATGGKHPGIAPETPRKHPDSQQGGLARTKQDQVESLTPVESLAQEITTPPIKSLGRNSSLRSEFLGGNELTLFDVAEPKRSTTRARAAATRASKQDERHRTAWLMVDRSYELMSALNSILMPKARWRQANLAAALDFYDIAVENGWDPVDDIERRIRFMQRQPFFRHIVMLATMRDKWASIETQEDRDAARSSGNRRKDLSGNFARV